MKTKMMIVSLLVVLASLAVVSVSCSTMTGFVTSSHVNWSFIQAVGGIKVGDPEPVSKGDWTVPIECDVSGLTMITTKPTTLNSALVVKNVRCKARQDKILIWVVACVATDRYKDSHWIQSITLKGVNQGKYTAQYLNPDGSTVDIRSVELRE